MQAEVIKEINSIKACIIMLSEACSKLERKVASNQPTTQQGRPTSQQTRRAGQVAKILAKREKTILKHNKKAPVATNNQR